MERDGARWSEMGECGERRAEQDGRRSRMNEWKRRAKWVGEHVWGQYHLQCVWDKTKHRAAHVCGRQAREASNPGNKQWDVWNTRGRTLEVWAALE